MPVHLNTQVRIGIQTNTYIHARMQACMHACIHTYVHACMHACIHTHIRKHMHADVQIRIHISIHLHLPLPLHACRCIHIHAHMYIELCARNRRTNSPTSPIQIPGHAVLKKLQGLCPHLHEPENPHSTSFSTCRKEVMMAGSLQTQNISTSAIPESV